MPLPLVAALRPNGSPVTWTGPFASIMFDLGLISIEQWRHYIKTGDAGALPPCDTTITVRALAAGREAEECEMEAGPREALGQLLHRPIQAAAVETVGSDDFMAISIAEARAIAELPAKDQIAIQRHSLRSERHTAACISRCLIAVDGEPTVAVDGGAPLTPKEAIYCLAENVRRIAVMEISGHINRLSTLSPAGK